MLKAPMKDEAPKAEDDLIALTERLSTALRRVISVARTNRVLLRNIMRADDLSALSMLVLSALETSAIPVDIRSRMAIEGALRFNSMIEDAGGAISLKDTADLLSRSIGSIQKNIERNQLLAFKRNSKWSLPVVQFNLETGEPLEGLRDLLAAFHANLDDKSKVIYCLSSYEDTGMNPLTQLRNGFSPSILAASAARYLEHGA